ncbi:hypothetical protein VTH82DRAFT_4910 [Thermothelomyces myriococcoides]
MEFSISPGARSPEPVRCSKNLHNIILQLNRRRLGDAFEAILDLGDELHDMVDPLHAVADLHLVDRLFSSIAGHDIYGIYPQVDRVIHRLVLLALRRCEEPAAHRPRHHHHQHRLGSGDVNTEVGWLLPGQSEVLDHLEVYRDFVCYMMSHSASCSSRDDDLASATKALQRLRPRINGLHTWVRSPKMEVDTGTEAGLHGQRGRTRNMNVQPITAAPPEGQAGAQSKRPTALQLPRKTCGASSAAKRQQPDYMLTPPTQSGDVNDTIPTIPVDRGRELGMAAPRTPEPRFSPDAKTVVVQSPPGLEPPRRPPASHEDEAGMPEMRKHEGNRPPGNCPPLLDDGYVGLATPDPSKSIVSPRRPDPVVTTFRLRPEHVPSSRCCSSL